MRWKALAEIYTMHSFAPFGIRSGKTLVKPPTSFCEKLVENLVKNLLKKCYLGKKCNLANFQRKIFENTKSGMPVVSLLC